MKKIGYILLIFCLVACKQNEMKTENSDMEVMATDAEDSFEKELLSSETISTKKLEEFMDLIKLKQEHPEFEKDIALQLESFTNNNPSAINYPKGFTISDIKQLEASKVISDSLEQFVLGFTVTANSETFKDSILTEIRSTMITIDGNSKVSKKVKFLPVSEK